MRVLSVQYKNKILNFYTIQNLFLHYFMLDIKTIEFKLSDESVQRLTTMFKNLWFGMPSWLRNLLIVVVCMGATYFLYNRIIISYDMESLQKEVKELNDKCKSSVFYDKYSYDVSNVITSVKTIENEVDAMYNDNQALLDLFESYVKRNHPGDQILEEIQRIRKQSQYTKETYDKIINYHLEILGKKKQESEN